MTTCCLKNITLFPIIFVVSFNLSAQCIKDSNFYSITYHAPDKNHIKYAAPVSDNEVVTLTGSDFVTKFTSQGQVIWSNEYFPDYPLDFWWQFPWYENTVMEGMVTGKDSTCFIYGSTIEHGTTLNNAGPPTHKAGFYLHLDKFGNVITGKYLGNWMTDYTVNCLTQLNNGNLVLYLRSTFFPFTSKLLCISPIGDLIWATPLQTHYLYSEVTSVNPFIKELSNGRIIVENQMLRTLDDTLFYPFLPPILVPAPLYYFHMFSVNASNGQVVEEYSYQCPPLKNTNVPNFIPRIKNITELPGQKLSFLADMYLPVDNVVFYEQRVYSRRIVNIITNMDGGFLQHFSYRPQNGIAVLQNGKPTGNNGEQIVLAIDSASHLPILFKLGADNQVAWSKSYTNELSSANLQGIFMEKQDRKGYFLFQTDPNLTDFHVTVTNAAGNNPCTELPGPAIVSEAFPWPWFAGKVRFNTVPPDVDFGIFPFKFAKRPYPLTQQINCQYQFVCCKDVIDSVNAHNISICEGQTYTLPDNTLVKETGTYYTTVQTTQGCDSILFYNIKVLKSPSHLKASADTCLNGSAVIQLRATEGYETYWWNDIATDKPVSEVHAPGEYIVRVQNMCGAKADTIVVYDQCDFPIYFPNAFTPNKDQLNDILKVPELNRNKFRRLRVFNRWGQIVFSTTKQGSGWDGTMKDLPQPAGVYVYILEMETLSGKKVEQKGTVALIR